jgi:uncharacterized protein YndB with AHSA1/START domain
MPTFHVSATADITAPPQRVMAILTDYRTAHPAILPPAFTRVTVLEGGIGAGTVIDVEVKAMGRSRIFHLTVTEPEPGRVLTETDAEAAMHTTFTVDPLDGGQRSRVTITSEMAAPDGLLGGMQAAIMRRYTANLYREELALLAAAAQQSSAP